MTYLPGDLQRDLVQTVRRTHRRPLEEARGGQGQVAGGVADAFEDLGPRRWRCCCRCCSTRFLRLFSSARCRLCNRKKNIDILRGKMWRGGVVAWWLGGWMLWRVDCRINFNFGRNVCFSNGFSVYPLDFDDGSVIIVEGILKVVVFHKLFFFLFF